MKTYAEPTGDTTRDGSVDATRFVAVEDLAAWQRALDDRGLRATGSGQHEDYIGDLAGRLAAAGVHDVRLEPVPIRRWTPQRWGLDLHDGDTMAVLPVVSYVAYSGRTGPGGVTGRLATTPGP